MTETLTLEPSDIIHTVTEPVRWKILKCLQVQKTAKQIAEELDLKAALVQYHLKRLVRAGVVDEFSHPDYRRRFLYIRRTLQAEVKMFDRGLAATTRVY